MNPNIPDHLNLLNHLPKCKYRVGSITGYWTYTSCKREFKYRVIDQIPVPFVMNPAFIKGNYIHEYLENWLNGESTKPIVPKGITSPETIIDWAQIAITITNSEYLLKFKEQFDNSEYKWVERFYKLMSPETESTPSERVFSGASDVLTYNSDKDELLIVDWKTGKISEKDYFQPRMYAMLEHQSKSDLNLSLDTTVIGKYVFVDGLYTSITTGEELNYDHTEILSLGDVYEKSLETIKYWNDVVHQINSETEWARTTETGKCRWCNFKVKCESDARDETKSFITKLISSSNSR